MKYNITISDAVYREKKKERKRKQERGGNRERSSYCNLKVKRSELSEDSIWLNTGGAGKSLHLSLIIEHKLEDP